MTLEEKIIFEKLTGECPIYCTENGNNRNVLDTHSVNKSEEFVDSKQRIDDYFSEIDRCLQKMDINRENYAFRRIYSCRAIVGGFIVFFKKIIRKCLKWYIEPVCNQQTEFNNAVTPSIGRLSQLQRLSLDCIQQHTDKLEKVADFETQLNQLKKILGEQSLNYTTVKCQIEQHQQDMQQQINEILQQLCQAREQLQDLREQGAFSEVISNEQVMKKSTAQSGEDMILSHILSEQHIPYNEITYLDLGANHAKFLSNTYYFYQKGVRGVLVEANPALLGELKFYRSGDVILNRCIASTSGETVDFYVLNGDGLSTPDKEGAEAAIVENPALKIERVVPVKTITVDEILDTYFDNTPTIVNLDIEGEEMNILNSLDFNKHRPLIMIIETIPYRKHLVVGLKNQEIVDFMASKNYIEYAFTGINSIFLDKEQIAEVLE